MPVAVPLSARRDAERRGRAPVEAAASGARPPPPGDRATHASRGQALRLGTAPPQRRLTSSRVDRCRLLSGRAAAGAATRSWREEGSSPAGAGAGGRGALTSSRRRQLSEKEILLGRRPRTRPRRRGQRTIAQPTLRNLPPAQVARSLRGHRLPAPGGFLRARKGEASSELPAQTVAWATAIMPGTAAPPAGHLHAWPLAPDGTACSPPGHKGPARQGWRPKASWCPGRTEAQPPAPCRGSGRWMAHPAQGRPRPDASGVGHTTRPGSRGRLPAIWATSDCAFLKPLFTLIIMHLIDVCEHRAWGLGHSGCRPRTFC